MKAIVGVFAVATVATIGDFIWYTYGVRHTIISGLVHGAVVLAAVGTVLGAAAGYGELWVLYWAFRLLARKEGMGFGDFKLLAALGAWLGTGHLLEMILVSSVVAAVTTLALIALKKMDRENLFPFGPFLAIAGVVSLLVGPLALPVV